jgi:hypothetical protein
MSDASGRQDFDSDVTGRLDFNSGVTGRQDFNSDVTGRQDFESDDTGRQVFNSDDTGRQVFNSDDTGRQDFDSALGGYGKPGVTSELDIFCAGADVLTGSAQELSDAEKGFVFTIYTRGSGNGIDIDAAASVSEPVPVGKPAPAGDSCVGCLVSSVSTVLDVLSGAVILLCTAVIPVAPADEVAPADGAAYQQIIGDGEVWDGSVLVLAAVVRVLEVLVPVVIVPASS